MSWMSIRLLCARGIYYARAATELSSAIEAPFGSSKEMWQLLLAEVYSEKDLRGRAGHLNNSVDGCALADRGPPKGLSDLFRR